MKKISAIFMLVLTVQLSTAFKEQRVVDIECMMRPWSAQCEGLLH